MAKASDEKRMEEALKSAKDIASKMDRQGTKVTENQETTGPRHGPSIQKDYSSARGRVRAKEQEQGNETQGVRITHTSWRDQVKDHREQRPAHTAEPAKEHQATATKEQGKAADNTNVKETKATHEKSPENTQQPAQEQAKQPEKQQGKESEKAGWKETKATQKSKEQEGGKDKSKEQDRGPEQER